MSSNWYANKLGTQSPAPAAPTPPVAPPQPPPYNPVPQQPQESPRLPQSATTSSACPGCGSGNYGKATPEAKARCYDCGYPVQQSGSGVGRGIVQQGGGAPTPARQVQTGGFSWTIGEKLG